MKKQVRKSTAKPGRKYGKTGSRYVSHFYYSPSTGREYYQNRRGRCEDAPCCGCCNC